MSRPLTFTGVCLSVCRSDDRACLQRLVFNMQASDIAKFDEVIQHNSSMDEHVRRALYANIRRQIARNFKQASRKRKTAICQYCKVMDEYVAFVVFSETDPSSSQDKTDPPTAVTSSGLSLIHI